MEIRHRFVEGILPFRWILGALTVIAVLWTALPSQAGEGAVRDAVPAGAMYTVAYPVADILSEIQGQRRLDAAGAKDFVKDRVKGPPVMRLEQVQKYGARFGEPQWRDEDLVVVANRAGQEQVAGMLQAFRKFGFAEYAISVRFITLPVEQAQKAFPDSTSSLLTMYPNPSSNSEAISPAVSELPLDDHDGPVVAKARMVVEEDSPMRFRVLDEDAATKLIKIAEGDRRSIVQAGLITTYSGQTASVSDVSHSQFVVGALVLSSGGRELKTRDVTEGTSMLLRPVAEPSGDIRLNFAASFSKIEKVTEENLRVAPGDEVVLQIPKVATLQINGGAVLKPGQSLVFGSVKRLSEGRSISWTDKLLGRPPKRDEQHLIVMLRVEPFELPHHAGARVSSVAKRN